MVAAEPCCIQSHKRITEASLLHKAQATFRLAFPYLNIRCSEDVLGTDQKNDCRCWGTRKGEEVCMDYSTGTLSQSSPENGPDSTDQKSSSQHHYGRSHARCLIAIAVVPTAAFIIVSKHIAMQNAAFADQLLLLSAWIKKKKKKE